MDKLVDYKEVPIGDEAVWQIEYKPVWTNDEVNNILRIDGWKPKVEAYACDRRDEVVLDEDVNYKIKVDEAGVYIDYNGYNPFESAKPVEKRGLYDLCIENHMDIPDSIHKESPCYRQFMKELERK